MMRTFIPAVVGSIAFVSGPVSAATVIFGAANPAGVVALEAAGPGAVAKALSFDVSGTGSFTAVFSFLNPFNPAAAGGSASFNYDPDIITFTNAFFSGGANTVTTINGVAGSSIQVDRSALAQGPQTLTFQGMLARPPGGNRFARIGGQLTLTAAVPEAATWALLVVGFGTIGAALRRRSGAARMSRAKLKFA